MMNEYLTDAAQDPMEIDGLCDTLRDEGVTSYLEIGSKFGGSLWKVANALPVGSRIVSVDMPNGTRAWNQSSASLKACILELVKRGYDARVIWGDSTDPAVIEGVRKLGPFDATLIDADHRMAGVIKDWLSYGHMAKIVAFHDIAWHREPEWKGTRIDVPEFWNGIKGSFKHVEHIYCPTKKNNGIGVLWRS